MMMTTTTSWVNLQRNKKQMNKFICSGITFEYRPSMTWYGITNSLMGCKLVNPNHHLWTTHSAYCPNYLVLWTNIVQNPQVVVDVGFPSPASYVPRKPKRLRNAVDCWRLEYYLTPVKHWWGGKRHDVEMVRYRWELSMMCVIQSSRLRGR